MGRLEVKRMACRKAIFATAEPAAQGELNRERHQGTVTSIASIK